MKIDRISRHIFVAVAAAAVVVPGLGYTDAR